MNQPISRRLFLTGPSGCGKSTLLRMALGSKISLAGGFVTERCIDKTGQPYFYLQRADRVGERAVFLDLRQAPPIRDNRPFSQLAAAILQERPSFALLDEIGGIELLLPEFQAALDVFLESDVPCIGVVKSSENSALVARAADLPESYLHAAEALRRKLESDENTRILELTGQNAPLILDVVAQWVKKYAHD